MDDSMIDLRRRSGPTLWTIAVTLAVLAVAAATGAVDAGAGTGARIGAGVCAGLCAVGVVTLVRATRGTRRLVIDHAGIRLDLGARRKPAFRLAWTEISGVGLLVVAVAAPHSFLLRLFRWPPPRVGTVLELVPADAEAVRRHPELLQAWRFGRERTWRVGLGASRDAPPVEPLVLRYRPELWRGERPGSLLSA
jgi:hypothetical protein